MEVPFPTPVTTTSSLCSSPTMNPLDDSQFAPTVSMQDLEKPAISATEAGKGPQKKRKSWGQVLPEPKTNLPPRKRAKTEDEKEQRRIERVKRNRLAAHNSRERKRQETEDLQVQNDRLQAQLRLMQDQMAQMQSQLRAYEQAGTPSSVKPALSSLSTSVTVDPREGSLLSSREGSVDSFVSDHMTSPVDAPSPLIKAESETATLMPDLTQHSAAMLCNDLQCQSDPSRAALSTTPNPPSSPSWIPLAISWLISLNIRLSYQTLLLTTWLTFPNWTNRMLSLCQATTRPASSRRPTRATSRPYPHPSRHPPWVPGSSSRLSPPLSPPLLAMMCSAILRAAAQLPTSPSSLDQPPHSLPRRARQQRQQQQAQEPQLRLMTLAQSFPSPQTLAQHFSFATSLVWALASSARTETASATSSSPASLSDLTSSSWTPESVLLMFRALAAGQDHPGLRGLEQSLTQLHDDSPEKHGLEESSRRSTPCGQPAHDPIHDEIQTVSRMLELYFREQEQHLHASGSTSRHANHDVEKGVLRR